MKCVISLGTRCFTHEYLKLFNFRKFSSPFDSLNLSSVNDIIYLLENKINKTELVYTQDDKRYESYNRKPPNGWGYRTIHTKMDNSFFDPNDYVKTSYATCTFPHHNLKDINVVEHFNKCFNRLDIIKKKK